MSAYRETEVAFTTTEWFDAQVNVRYDDEWWEEYTSLPKEFESWEYWEKLRYLREQYQQYGY